MAGKPGTSQLKYQKETKRLCVRLMKKVEDEERVNDLIIPRDQSMQRAERYTGFHPLVLEELKSRVGHAKDFSFLTEDTLFDIDRSLIHNGLIKFYLEDKILPTTKQLFLRLFGELPPYMDISSFRNILVKLNYVWKKLSNDSFVIIERPLVTYEKYQYLKRIQKYRNEGRFIYFVDECCFNVKGSYNSVIEMVNDASDPEFSRVIYAVSRHGINFIEPLNVFDETTFRDWLTDEVIPVIPIGSVIVINNTAHHCEEILSKPTIQSVRYDMKKWLDYYDVPYSEDMSKQELYSLIELNTNTKENIYSIDKILKMRGLIPLRIPNIIINLTPASLVCSLIKNNIALYLNENQITSSPIVHIQEILNNVTSDQLLNYDNYIANEEKELLDAILKIDESFDELCDKTSRLKYNAEIEDSDLPEESDDE